MKITHFWSARRLASLLLLLMTSMTIYAQNAVQGMVYDAQSGEPVIGAAVIQSGTTNGTVTDIDGYFSLSVDVLPADIDVTFLGYKPVKIGSASKNVGMVLIEQDTKALDDVVVKGSIATSRKTPVALSSITPQLIEEKLGAQEFPEILKSTPGVHANKQGGGYGDSEIYMRGFDNTNVAVMINGVPMNDMENGTVYWSNWSGLSDVVSSTQTQRGLGASKVSAPSCGGTINMVTKGIDSKRGGTLSYMVGNDSRNKILFSYNTGLLDRGWAISVLFAKDWGNGQGQGMEFEGYNYFFSINKRLNDSHQLSFSIFGAPQTHNQRNASYGSLTLSEWKKAEKIYGIEDYKYNAGYGFGKNGERKMMWRNHYHKPQMSLNHQWQINEKSNLSTSIYASLGRGYGYSGEANSNLGGSYSDFRGAYNGVITTKFRKEDGTFDYAAMQEANETSEHGSVYVMSKSSNSHNWFGLLSTYTTNFLGMIDFYGGLDFRYYEGYHTNKIIDLYNGDYYIDECRADVSADNNYKAADSDWVNQKLHVGDVIYRDYVGHTVSEGGFFQAEYNRNAVSAFVAGSLSNTTYWRYDKFYYDEDHAKSEVMNYLGGTIKGGANYNINDHHNVFVNVGFISRAPKFSYGAFMSSTTSNATNPDAKNEKILSFEVGYGYKNSLVDVKLNGYYTKWLDKTMTKSGTLDNQEDYYMNMTGVDALHKGIELEVAAPLARWVELKGMLSIGDWQWDSDATGYAYDEHGNALTEDGEVTTVKADDHAWSTINLKGVRVGGSAQTTAALGVNFNVSGFRIGADWTLAARNYTYYSFSGSNLSLGKETTIADPYKLPSASTLDANASYKFNFGSARATISGNVNNLLNYHYFIKASNSSTASEVTMNNIYGFLDMGRTWTVRLKLAF